MIALDDHIFGFHVKTVTLAVGYGSLIRDLSVITAALLLNYQSNYAAAMFIISIPVFFLYCSYRLIRGTNLAKPDDFKWWIIKTGCVVWFSLGVAFLYYFGLCAGWIREDIQNSIKGICCCNILIIYAIFETWLLNVVSRCAAYFKETSRLP